jgi:hypothetical protein
MEKTSTISGSKSKVTVILNHGYDKRESLRINCSHIEVRDNLLMFYSVDHKKGHDRILHTDEYKSIDILHSGLEDPS